MNKKRVVHKGTVDRENPIHLKLSYKLPKRDRLKINVEKFKLYPNGDFVTKKADSIIENVLSKYLSNNSLTELKLKYFILNSFYDELFLMGNMHNMIMEDNKYNQAFSNYLAKVFVVKQINEFEKAVFDFSKIQTEIFYKYNPYLFDSSFLGEAFFNLLKSIVSLIHDKNIKFLKESMLKERGYAPNRLYSDEMFKEYNELRTIHRHKANDAASIVLNKYLKNVKEPDDKVDSFMRRARDKKL